jgi:hypothetical protein
MNYPSAPAAGRGFDCEAQRETNRFAIASLVLGIAGLLSLPTLVAVAFDYKQIVEHGAMLYIAIFGVPGVIFGLLGIIFGKVALKRPAVIGGQQGGRGMALAGVVVGGATPLIWVMWFLNGFLILWSEHH